MFLPSGLSAAGLLLDEIDTVQLERLGQFEDAGCYHYVPLPLERWCFSMDIARDYLIQTQPGWRGTESYLEVGSGLGTKLRLARLLGWNPAGLELHPPFVEYSRRLGLVVELGDAREYTEFDFFDLVFVYRCCRALADERELLQRIVNTMRSGALLLHAGEPDPLGCEHIGGEIWRVP